MMLFAKSPQLYRTAGAICALIGCSGIAVQAAPDRDTASEADQTRGQATTARTERERAERERKDRERADPPMRPGNYASMLNDRYENARRGTTVIIVPDNAYPVYVPQYGVPQYGVPVYAPNCPPYVGNYGGYPPAYGSYGSSLTFSTPGFSNGTFTQYPGSFTVQNYGTQPYPSYPATRPSYPAYPNYPAYPAYPVYGNSSVARGGYTVAPPTVTLR